MTVSRWRRDAKAAIAAAIASAYDVNPSASTDEVFDAVSAAYPFGPRKWHPYKIWLDEVSKTRARLLRAQRGSEPLDRPCPACGAKAGKPCRDIAETPTPLRAAKRIDRSLAASVMHAARKEPHGPLFGGNQDA